MPAWTQFYVFRRVILCTPVNLGTWKNTLSKRSLKVYVLISDFNTLVDFWIRKFTFACRNRFGCLGGWWNEWFTLQISPFIAILLLDSTKKTSRLINRTLFTSIIQMEKSNFSLFTYSDLPPVIAALTVGKQLTWEILFHLFIRK